MTMSLAGRRRPGPAGGPVANLEGLWNGATVGAQIGEAIATLMALPDRERDWLMSCRSRWPTPKAAPGDDLSPAGRRRRSPPTPGAIDRMLPTLLWIRELDEAGQRVLWMRGLGMSWARIGAEIGRSGQTARRWHDAALELIAARLNRRMQAQAQAQSLARAQASAHTRAQAPSGPARR